MLEVSAIQAARAERAYAPAASLASAAPSSTPAVSFEDFVGDTVANAVETVRRGETVASAGLRGEASAQDVARAILTAETTLQTVVVVRDKVVQAYQELLRMQV